MAHVLLVLPHESYRTRDFLRAAQSLDATVTVASDQPALFKDLAGYLPISFSLPSEAVASILAYANQYPLDAVVAGDDRATLVAALAARALGLSHNEPQAVQIASDKFQMRLRLKRAGVVNPWFRRVPLSSNLEHIAMELTYPVVVKPLHLCASRGVIRADDAAEFIAACERVRAVLSRVVDRGDYWQRQSVLVESFIHGEEVAIEGLLDRGQLQVLAMFDKPGVSHGPLFEETVYVTPSRMAATVQQRTVQCLERAAHALGLRNGALHAELRFNEQGIWIIEVAPRSIGVCALER